MSKVIVIHGLRANSRPTTVQNVLSISKYLSVDEINNVNGFGLMPEPFHSEVVILTYDFLALRTWPMWKTLVNRVRPVIESAEIRVAMPQDDYTFCHVLDEFICELKITHVYSPITNNLHVIYPRAVTKSLIFGEALTGYVDEMEFARVTKFAKPYSERALDLGQRVRLLPPHLGARASDKGAVAVSFSKLAAQRGFRCDVSTRDEDVLLGDDWYRFLGNTRFTVSAKGGASMADPRGRLADQVRRMRLRKAAIQDDEIRTCLKTNRGRPGNFAAISPRIFEAAAMGVCQILKRDDYLEGFEPWKHYVPIDSVSRLDDAVIKVMRDHERAIDIVRSSQEFLIYSGNYTYKRFLQRVADEVGLTTTISAPQVSDSSSELDAAIGDNGLALCWVQSYLARAFANGALRRVEKSLNSGKFLALHESDNEWASHAESSLQSLLLWVEALRSKRLIVESVAIPWRSASSYLRSWSGTTV